MEYYCLLCLVKYRNNRIKPFKEKNNKVLTVWPQLILTMVQVLAIYYSIKHLIDAHKYLAWNREMRNKIENLLGFFEKDVYIPNAPVLPEEKNNISRYYRIGFNDYIFPFVLFLVIYELFTIYLIWTV